LLDAVLLRDDIDIPTRTLRAWDDVAKQIFPRNEIINSRRFGWVVHREPFMGPEGEIEQDKPEAIVVRSAQTHQNAQEPQQQRQSDFYNWLIIETKPPSRDTPEGWKELLMQACSRVRQYDDGSHDVYIICAVGLKYMAFYWDPRDAGNPKQELRLGVAGVEVHFPSQLKPDPGCSPHVPNLKNDGNPDQYRIDLSRVWSIDPGQVDAQGHPMEPLTTLERFITHTRTTPLQNPTPPIEDLRSC
jgi:hypothetical protein